MGLPKRCPRSGIGEANNRAPSRPKAPSRGGADADRGGDGGLRSPPEAVTFTFTYQRELEQKYKIFNSFTPTIDIVLSFRPII